jgi:lipopolysaccharide assembly protein A
MRYLAILILALTALVGISFAVLNAKEVPFDYYIGTTTVPLSFLLVGSLVIGIGLGMLALLPSLFRLSFRLRRLRREIKRD